MPEPPPAARDSHDDRFDRFLRERRPPLLRFLLRMRVGEDDAQDIAQESLVRMLRYRDREPEHAWQALLYRIAINVVRDRARQMRADRTALPYEESDHAADDSPEQHASDGQVLAQLRRAILGLPPRCREVYLLHRIEGMTYPEIARRSGISLKAVEKNISRALRLLRAQLAASAAASTRPHGNVP